MNEDLTFEEKIKRLRERHAHSHIDARQQISKWEEDYAILKAQADWISHPTTVKLLEIASEQIKNISVILHTNEKLSDLERANLFAQKKAHLVYVAILSEKPEEQLKTIEDLVISELI